MADCVSWIVRAAAIAAWIAWSSSSRPSGAPAGDVVRADPVDIGLLVLAVSLSLLAQQIAKAKQPSFARDDKPTTIATRGAFIPWVLGPHRGGPVFGWAGNRRIVKESTGGGKGGGNQTKERVYYESGWHLLACNGPFARLRRITQNGKVIFTGPIDPSSHPSGSSIDLGSEGSFRVFWGEGDQPVNTFLGNAGRVGISSRWPYLFYIEWTSKRLGTSALWPLLDYEYESRPASQLTSSRGWFEPTRSLSGTSYPVDDATNGVPGTAKIRLDGHHAARFTVGGRARLTGNSVVADQDLLVHRATNYFITIGLTDFPKTDVVFDQTLSGVADDGDLEPYINAEDDGANPAHLIDVILFEEFPHGCALDRANFDVESLESLGQLFEAENLKTRAFAQDRELASAVVASLMQDAGFMLPLDPQTGLQRFHPIRAVDPDAIPILTASMLLPPKPERRVKLEATPIDRAIYTFSDRARGFRDMPVNFDDDAQAQSEGKPRQQPIQLASVVDYATAAMVAERRSQEDGAGNGLFKLHATREARLLFPGLAIKAASLPNVLRVVSVDPDPDSGKTTIEAMVDNYGVEASTFAQNDGGSFRPEADPPENDLGVALLEIPASQFVGKKMVAAVVRRRATATTAKADIYLSADGTSYVQVAANHDTQTGGTLATAITFEDDMVWAQGPTIDVDDPDIATAIDLSADLTNWRLGRQLALIDDELFFVQKVTALGGNQYRLDGLLRARFDTDRAAHAIGADVFLFLSDSLETWEDPLLVPLATRFLKSQPSTGESLPLDDVVPVELTLYGKGIRPPAPQNLRVSGSVNAYVSGDVVHLWSHRSVTDAGTGAGEQDAGTPMGSGAVDGVFVVRIKNSSGSSILRTTTTSALTFTYGDADRTADGISGSNYRIAVAQLAGGYESPEEEVLVLKVT